MIHIMLSKSIKEKLKNELKRAQTENNAQVYRRVAVLLCYANEVPNEEIVKIFRICVRTIYNWLTEFIIKGFRWFISLFKGRGRKPKLSKEQRDYMRDAWKVIAKMKSLREKSFKLLEKCTASC